jgi:hypothetical protein
MHVCRRYRPKIALAGAYGGGALASWWLAERVIACVSGG